MRSLLLSFACLLSGLMNSQAVQPSNTYVRTCLNDLECSAINSSSFIYYDEARQKFYIKIDFNRMKTGHDSVDFWLEDLTDTYFYFKASLPKEQFPTLSTYNSTNFKMVGQSFLNNRWHDQSIDITIYRAEHDLMNNTVNASKFEAYKVNFSFSFSPRDFDIHKKPQRLSNIIFIGVGGGIINVLNPGMEDQVGEAFDH